MKVTGGVRPGRVLLTGLYFRLTLEIVSWL